MMGYLFLQRSSFWDSGKEKSRFSFLNKNKGRLLQLLLTALTQPQKELRLNRKEKRGKSGPGCHKSVSESLSLAAWPSF